MSYAISPSLQTAIYDALLADPSLAALIGTDIYDAVPSGAIPETYVSLGDERVQDASDQTASGAIHLLHISVVSTLPGFSKAKSVAAAISDALHDVPLLLSRGRLVYLRFERAEARRIESKATREILLRFRARVDDQ